MRPTRSLGHLAVILLGVSTASASWPNIFPPLEALVARQDSATSTSDSKATATTAADKSSVTKAVTTANLNTASVGKDSTASGSGKSGNATTTKHKTYDARLPAGGVSMILPKTTTLALFKIGDYVTLSWNYTSLSADPTAVDVMAVDSTASQTHTLTANMSFQDPAAFTWDTNKYQSENGATKPLRVAKYTLWIYDSDKGPSATAEAGYLGVYNSFSFGLYTPQSYTPLNEWVCVACSAAPGNLAIPAAGLALTLAFGAGIAVALL